MTTGWGFDFDFRSDLETSPLEAVPRLEEKMERHVARFAEMIRQTGDDDDGSIVGYGTSITKERQMEKAEKKRSRDEKRKATTGSKPRNVR